MSSNPQDTTTDSITRAQSQYQRKVARQQKLKDMDRYAKGVEDLLGEESTSNFLAILEEASHSSRGSCSSGSHKSIPNGMHAPPEGAVETARKFLWDEDDDDVSLPPPSRGFDGRVEQHQHDEEQASHSSDTTSSQDKKPRAANKGLGRLFGKKYTAVSTSDPVTNLAPTCAEFGAAADASSTISSYEESDTTMVRIELGDPADIMNRPRRQPPSQQPGCARRACRVVWGKCRSVADALCIMCGACLHGAFRCCIMAGCSRRRKVACLCTLLVLPILILGGMALYKHSQDSKNAIAPLNNETAFNETGTLAPEMFTEPPVPVDVPLGTEAPIQINTEPPESETTEAPVIVNETEATTEAPVSVNETEATDTPVSVNETEATEAPVNETEATEAPTESTESPGTESPTEGTEAPSTESPVINSTESPTKPPTTHQEEAPPYNVARYEAIRAAIAGASLTSDEQLQTLGTAQNKALLWITDFDGSQIEVDPPAPLLQRYALATLFFSTTTSSTVAHGYSTLAEEIQAVLTDPQPTWDRGENWMTEQGVCVWEGIKCDDDENDVVIHLNLTTNNLRGMLPSELVAMQQLQSLELSNNILHGPIPTSLGAIKTLAGLDLMNNDLTGTVPTEMGQLASLHMLNLGRNHFRGSIPYQLMKIEGLSSLLLDENLLTGTLPNVSRLQNLQNLTLTRNLLVGSIPTEYGAMTTLVDLRVSENKLDGTIPTEFQQLSRLESLDIGYNGFYSTIPPDMFESMANLQELNIKETKLSGQLPPSLGSLKALRMLSMERNYFSGSIHSSLGQLSHLETLILSSNNLVGTIPANMDGWKANMTDFRISRNALIGPIPPALGSVVKLEVLHLEDNNLVGPIPTTLGKLSNLRSFRFYGNNFEGAVPEDVCDLVDHHELEDIAGDCSKTNGAVQCSCCQECH